MLKKILCFIENLPGKGKGELLSNEFGREKERKSLQSVVTQNIALNAFRPIIVACSWDIEFLYYFKSMGKGGPRGVF